MSNAKRILLVQLYSNGDCLYATAVARQIKEDFPGCNLTWVIAGFCQQIIDHNPFVDEKLVTNEVPKNDVVAFRKFKRKVYKEKEEGKWDEVFVTHNMDDNQALYDGTIRGMIFRAYPNPITVPIQPVLVLSDEEKERVKQFAEEHKLNEYKNVILWEFAPQSGQTILSFDFVKKVAAVITENTNTCIILSSSNSFENSEKIIDGSTLSVRENAALTHYCSLFIGCSSGITWLATSSAAKPLPMLQLLDPQAYFRNAPSIDFKRFDLSTDHLIELYEFNEDKLINVINAIINGGVFEARSKFNEAPPLQFKTTRKVVYNMLCYLQFGAIKRHFNITKKVFGIQPLFLKEFILAFLSFPFKLVANYLKKR